MKQAPGVWCSRIESYLLNNGFKINSNEPTLYTKLDQQGTLLIFCLYVDDIIYIGNLRLADFKIAMKKEFKMIDIGIMKYFLGINVEHSDKGIFIFKKYVKYISERFKMRKCK